MARWLVTDGDKQFSVRDFNELKQAVQQGRIGPGTMIQPPGATDWVYASEVPQLKDAFRQAAGGFPGETDPYAPTAAKRPTAAIVGVLVAIIAIGGFFFYKYAVSIPDVKDLTLLGGSKGLELTEMLVTMANAPLRSSPSESASEVRKLDKDSKIQLLAKQKGWYQAESSPGVRGWIKVDHVVPAYYFASEKEREALDPIYNPDKYISVENSRWMQLPPEKTKGRANPDEAITVFEFLLKNQSRFEMTDLKLVATIKNRSGRVLEEKEIEVQGKIPAWESVPVGTLNPPEKDKTGTKQPITYPSFTEMARGDEEMWLRWTDGIEVPMTSSDYSEADINLLQVRAVIPTGKK